MTNPRSAPLTVPELAGLVALGRRIGHIQGWLSPREAWELHETARRAAAERGSGALVVEIGSWRGRSTVALALGLRAGGGGRLVSIDPHELADERHEEVHANLREAGAHDLVDVVRGYSHDERHRVGDGAADLVFIDGDHAYESVRQDLADWETAVRPGGTIALNDPYWPGVKRLCSERIATAGSPFRRPRLVVNTLFVEYRPDAPWGPEDEELAQALRRLLRFIGRWYPVLSRLRKRAPGRRITWRVAMYGARRIKRLYPLVDLAHHEWSLEDS